MSSWARWRGSSLRRSCRTGKARGGGAGLCELLGPAERPAGRPALREAIKARTGELCERIQRGDADAVGFREAVLGHVRRTVRDKLLVTTPGWLGAAEGGGEASSGG